MDIVKATAAVFVEANTPISTEQVQLDDPGDHDVVVRMTAAGVCHTDLSAWSGALPTTPPLVLGHEGCGIIDHVGSRVEGLKVGQRVVMSPLPTCRRCRRCLGGQPTLCEARGPDYDRFVTTNAGQRAMAFCGLGAFSELAVVHSHAIVPVGSSIPDDQLSLLGCGVGTGLGSVFNVAKVEVGATVVVVGCGGVGLAAVEGARIAGAAQIIAVDPVAERRVAATEIGATDVLDVSGDPVDAVRALTQGAGVDYGFEASGRSECAIQVVDMVRRGGMAVFIGAPPSDAEWRFKAFDLKSSAKTLAMSYLVNIDPLRDIPTFAAMAAAGTLRLDRFVSRQRPLSEINEAFADLEAGVGRRNVIVFE